MSGGSGGRTRNGVTRTSFPVTLLADLRIPSEIMPMPYRTEPGQALPKHSLLHLTAPCQAMPMLTHPDPVLPYPCLSDQTEP